MISYKRENRLHLNYNWKLIASYVSLSFLIMLGTNHSVFTIFSLVLSCIIIIKSKTDETIGFLFFLLPFAGVFKISGFALFNIIYFLTIIKFIYNKRGHLPRNSILLILLFTVYNFAFSWREGVFDLIKLSSYFLLAALLFFNNKQLNFKKILIVYSLGILLAAIYAHMDGLFSNISNIANQATIRIAYDEHIDRFGGLYNNPNFFTMDIIMSLSCWICFFIKKNLKKIEYFMIILLSIFGFMSLSNSFLLAYAVLLTIALINILKNDVKKGITSIAVMFIFLVIVWNILDEQIINTILERVYNMRGAQNAAAITTGRSDRWTLYLQYIFSNLRVLLFGDGLTVRLVHHSHNYFIEILYHFGIIGSLIYLFNLKFISLKYAHLKNRKLINYIPMIVFFIRAFAINLLFRDNTIFFIILVIIALNTNFERQDFEINKY